MAKESGSGNSRVYSKKVSKTRPGIHSKTKSGRNKGSKNYLKKYKGQGR